jgi:outer membrane biosynthesis protein TonB
MPETISGLTVSGARSEQNVIQNLWPVVCMARQKYRARLQEKPNLEGTIELQLSVEFNGEIGPHGIARSTLADPVLEKQVLRLLQFMDFDPYGPQNSESEIVFPIHLKP